ncbi:hypothetical protein H5S09_09255 [Limosilactobacillus sp. STM2_1]|uniref:DUF4767 domain-containing protein n=1 Tax=Limosilactobacillus rudii TaxID=2759755 RepID=A0A7W3UM60_9LACO|nr:hypothetical protein [Limosilactobacillus rudii]MBB1079990.1 hypothetical protein [Limosilactobacillus rudii]MBB1098123.1 hypothetical protein [Limosilactobacillus rudii]MCD7135193.1 hypothetical protein [Limosilactobacillus rudii]
MNKKIGMLMATGMSLLLVGCGNQNNKSTASSSSSSNSLLTAKSSVQISSNNLTPQETVSLISTYCGLRYGGEWAAMVKQAHENGLQVNLYPSSKYRLSDNGQGVAYDVTAGGKSQGLVYTVNNDDINIYQNVTANRKNTKIATVSKAAMASYVNQKKQGKLVNDLAAKAQVVDKRNSNTSSVDNDENDHKYGRLGVTSVPSEMQGTWYSADNDADSTVVFSAHSCTYQDKDSQGTTNLYKQDPHFLDNEDTYLSKQVQDATKDWGRTSFFNLDGLRWLNIRGWTQTAGDGSSYAVKTETVDGKPVKVLVAAGGAGNWTEAVYYQSKEMAQQNADKKFDDLHYMDDE